MLPLTIILLSNKSSKRLGFLVLFLGRMSSSLRIPYNNADFPLPMKKECNFEKVFAFLFFNHFELFFFFLLKLIPIFPMTTASSPFLMIRFCIDR